MNKELARALETLKGIDFSKLNVSVTSDGRRFTLVTMVDGDGNVGAGFAECSPDDVYDRQEGYNTASDRAIVSLARAYKANARMRIKLAMRALRRCIAEMYAIT